MKRDKTDTAWCSRPRAGAKRQFFGCVLLGLGILDAMFGLRAGTGADYFTLTLVIAGAAVLASGVISSKGREKTTRSHHPLL